MNTTQLIQKTEDILNAGVALQDSNRMENRQDIALDVFLRHLGNAVRFSKALAGNGDAGATGELVGKPVARAQATPDAASQPAAYKNAEEQDDDYLKQFGGLTPEQLEERFSEQALQQLLKFVNRKAADTIALNSDTTPAMAIYRYLSKPAPEQTG
jgi:hypothetical protein